jgi:anhydro-N-acetylmuramic acid kinase
MQNSHLKIIGMMSGTSLDGIDACLVDVNNYNNNFDFKISAKYSLDYPESIKNKIFDIANNHATTSDICNMHFVIGKLYAQCVLELLEKNKLSKNDIDYISAHGQTVFHIPTSIETNGISTASTLQIGNISVISELTGIKTIGDFRSKDMVVGGQGAPLVPFADEIIFKKEIPRAIQNIGGIGNVTVLSKNCETFAFDTGPGNVLIDYYVKKLYDLPFDKNGEIAKSGKVDENWLNNFLQNEYYQLQPPKSTGRELFNDQYAEEMLLSAPETKEDIIATITALTAKTIEKAYEKFVFPKTDIKEIVLGGGGAYNLALLKFLQEYLPNIEIKTHENFGIDNKYKEALAFALLGFCTINNIPNNIPACTGAKKRVIMGVVSH